MAADRERYVNRIFTSRQGNRSVKARNRPGSWVGDNVGNLMTKTDRKSQTISYAYDTLDRLLSKTYPDSTSVAYTYDDAGRVTQVQDPTGTYSFIYDNMSRLKQTTAAYSFVSGNPFTVVYGYDAASNRNTLTDPSNAQTTYSYDTLNRLTNILDFNNNNFGFGYDALSRRTQLTRPNGINTKYAYDTVSNLLSVAHQQGASTLDGATYTYDSAGNRKSKTNLLNSNTANFSYDNIYQLTGVTGNSPESYTYDPVGNRLTSLAVPSYSYNSSNELTLSSAASYTYDNNGNTLTKTVSGLTAQYTWDFENRLISVQPPSGGTVSFKYDPFGRRIQKAGASITDYVYDGADVVEEVDSSENLLAKYSQGAGIDEPLSELRSGAISYYEQDGLGSVTSLSNIGGSLANTYVYDSFGNLTASAGNTTNPYQYTGRDYDPETGLRSYRARYLDPTAGRFLSEDPEGFSAASDFYPYTGNDPVNWTDPEGLRKVKVCRQPLRAYGGTLRFLCHTYIRVFNDDGTQTTYGILGDEGTTKNQIPRRDDPRNNGKHCKDVGNCDDSKIDKLINGLEQAVNSKSCPSCGANYQAWIRTDLLHFFDGYNSNTFTFNMIKGAGMKPPKEGRCPGYHEAAPKSGSWY